MMNTRRPIRKNAPAAKPPCPTKPGTRPEEHVARGYRRQQPLQCGIGNDNLYDDAGFARGVEKEVDLRAVFSAGHGGCGCGSRRGFEMKRAGEAELAFIGVSPLVRLVAKSASLPMVATPMRDRSATGQKSEPQFRSFTTPACRPEIWAFVS